MKREVRIGIFLVVAIAILAGFIFVIGDVTVIFKKQGYPLSVTFPSASGLEEKSVIRMAGVKIGYVKDIRLKENQAEVLLNIDFGIKVPRGSRASLAALGLLGEKHIEIIPGEETTFCQPGDSIEGIPHVSFDQMGTVLMSLGNEFREIAETLQELLAEEPRADFKNTLRNLSSFSSDLKNFLATNRGDFEKGLEKSSQAVSNVEKRVDEVSKSLDELILSLKNLVEDNKESVRINLENIRKLIEKTEESLRLLNQSLEKINKGEGTLGKLISKPELYERAEGAVEGIERMIQPVSSLNVYAGVRTEYYGSSRVLKNTFTLDLWSGEREHLLAQVVHDPWQDRFVYSAQGGIRIGPFSPRVGIIESKLGAAVDFYAIRKRLKFSLEGFDFQRSPRPDFRLWSTFSASRRVHLILGLNDFTLVPEREVFFGLEFGF
jgi:ABC-type transporter Mla subunit MlaD